MLGGTWALGLDSPRHHLGDLIKNPHVCWGGGLSGPWPPPFCVKLAGGGRSLGAVQAFDTGIAQLTPEGISPFQGYWSAKQRELWNRWNLKWCGQV